MKKIMLLIIISAIIVCCLFPPWRGIYKEYNSNIKKFTPAGYSFIADPPDVLDRNYSRHGRTYKKVKADTIDFSRLGIQISLLIFLGFCIVFSRYIFPQISLPKKKRKSVSKLRKQFIRQKQWAFIRKIFFYPAFGVLIFGTIILSVNWIEAENWALDCGKQMEIAKKTSKINTAFLDKMEKKPYKSKINMKYLDELEGKTAPDKQK